MQDFSIVVNMPVMNWSILHNSEDAHIQCWSA